MKRRVFVKGDLCVTEDGSQLERRLERLTEAERVVARQALEGLGVREIAQLRGVSAHTVRGQIEDIYKAYGVKSRIELVHALEGA